MSDLLEIAARVLEGVTPPDGAFDPAGAWRHAYGIFNLAANLAKGAKPARNLAGTLIVGRTPRKGGGAVLDIDLRRRVPPRTSERISGRMICGEGPLAAPTSWGFTWEASGPGSTGSLRRTSQSGFPPSSPYTLNWALFDAVQRQPRRPGEPLRFTLFDEFDLGKPNQSLAFRKTADVRLAKGPVKLHAFEQFGEGVLPVLYWTDDHGRLLLVISGLIAYVMEDGKK